MLDLNRRNTTAGCPTSPLKSPEIADLRIPSEVGQVAAVKDD